jgi:aminoglycoside phosphotransferase (APT) family kinase protein
MSFDARDMAERLEGFLRRRLPDASAITVSDCELMTGGYSRIMSRFTATIDGETQEFVARADSEPGQALFDTDRTLEWEILSALTEDGATPMPKALFYDEDGSELGAKTIVLEMIDGEPFLKLLRATGNEARPDQADALCTLVAEIHGVNTAVLPPSVERPPDWNTYVDSLIEEWRRVERDHAESDPFFRYMARWLDENRPAPAPLTLVHGEFQTSNVVVDSSRRALAVDWEFAHIGDPREDLGWCKFVAAMQPPDLIGHDEPRFLERYRSLSGLGENVINPLTIAYFSILPSIRVWQGFSKQQRAFVEGVGAHMMMAYSLSVLVTAHEGWMQAVEQIGAALVDAQAVTK